MSYIEQMKRWLAANPNATVEQVWQAGYLQATANWVNKERFGKDYSKPKK